jgi:hypothetical protein
MSTASITGTLSGQADAERYLDALAALAPVGALLDVRYRIAGAGLARFFLPVRASGRAALLTRIGRRTDVYVGVAPRLRRSGARGDVAPTALLWADCDSPEASKRLRLFVPPASMIVASGTEGHTHGYWLLSEPIHVGCVEQLNRRLAAALGADPRCAEAARILRVPGTLSFKHRPPRPIRLRRYVDAGYARAELDAVLPVMGTPLAAERRPLVSPVDRSHDPLQSIPPPEYLCVLTGQEVGRDGKTRCPFHDDHIPSLHAYPTPEDGWTCFGCITPSGRQLGGDIYTLASHLWRLPSHGQGFRELRDRLDRLFGVTRG